MSESTMYVYSGKCRLGTVGRETPFKDCCDRPLFVGDIVCIFTTGGAMPDHLTAVVSSEFTSYSDGTHKTNDGPLEQFVMGIKEVAIDGSGDWRVFRVKSHADVIDGEHWPEYGFRYSTE